LLDLVVERASHLLLGLAEKIFDEKRYIGRALTQRGSIDRQYGNPVKEILSEFARTDLLVKLAIRWPQLLERRPQSHYARQSAGRSFLQDA